MRRFILLLFCSIWGLTSVAFCQTTETAKIDSLESRLARLEKREATREKLKQYFKVSGFLQAGYEWVESSTSTFYIRRARVTLAGDIYNGTRGAKCDYKLQVDFAGSPKIVDLILRYQPVNAFGIQIGQFKIPLSIENSEFAPPLRLEFNKNALVVRRMAHISDNDVHGIKSSGRNLGMQIFGNIGQREGFSLINYVVALFNGNGINILDDNRSKDVVARLMVNPIKDLTIAGYYQYGEGEYKDFTGKLYTKTQRYGGGVAYDGRSAFVRGEYIGGTTASTFAQGAYIQAGYKFLGKGLVGARFDYFDFDTSVIGHEFDYTVAISYCPWKFLRLQLDYTYRQYIHLSQRCTNGISFMATAMF